ncbi:MULTISPECIES: hypothetical protein [unclassified Streptomyces]|uniref:hypothetical protein n=1 Tax=unclassified Streptomyces TaxID=2593676 RepID=UPI0033E9285A
MGCWTAYALRAEDGTSWVMGEKWGMWDLTDATDRVRLVAMRNTDRRALRVDPRNLRTPRVEVVDDGRES